MKQIKNKVILKFKYFLSQGISAEKLAITIALGIVIGSFPVMGIPTGLCVIAAMLFNLNHIAIQAANYGSYPLMFVSILPLYKLGNILFNGSSFDLTLNQLITLYKTDFITALSELSWIIFSAVLLWILLAPFAVLLIYWFLKPVLVRMQYRRQD